MPSQDHRLVTVPSLTLYSYHMTVSQALRKVPEITLAFWVVKSFTTAVGESVSDFLVLKIDPYLAVAIGGLGLVIALGLQFSVRRYIPWTYWLAVVMVAIFGTMAADGVHIQLGIPYIVSTVFFAIVLAILFYVWYRTEKTLSIHSITTRRREVFYWTAVLATFAFGTALGDMTAFTLHLGYLVSILLFALVIGIIAFAHWRFRLNGVAAFWLAYILTRPFGASIAVWIAKSQTIGGLGIGDEIVSIVLALLIIVSVGYMTFSRKEARRENTIAS
jgi:uncharacterized membrane-anchored protein